SSYILAIRFLRCMAAYQWRKYSLFVGIYFIFAYMLKIFFNFRMVQVSGCIDINANFNATCELFENYENLRFIQENGRYVFFSSIMYIFFVYLQVQLSFQHELVHVRNEQRNGWYR